MRRTKIVCTLGPSSDSPDTVRRLMRTGMDVARLNFSHGAHATHQKLLDTVRATAAELNRNVAVMMDLQGPKIRTGVLKGGRPVELVEGETICITTRDVPGDAACVSTTYDNLPTDVKAGDRLLLADGALELQAEKVGPPDIQCRIVRGGMLGQHKGINLPGVAVSAPSLTEKDLKDLDFALGAGADYVALSFVRHPDDVRGIKQRIEETGKDTHVIAKIERPEAIAKLDEILELADGAMVARGDLGVEMNLEDIPQIQKDLIARCNRLGKPVITATQMLESMMTSARPTRAEVGDVANAIYDGTDAVMLSGETAAGKYPVRAAQVMADVAARADEAIAASPTRERRLAHGLPGNQHASFSSAIGRAVGHIAQEVDAKRIVCFTMSGYTARMIARNRPGVPITVFTLNEATQRRCALLWGVDAMRASEVNDTDEMVGVVDELLVEHNLARGNDTVIIVAGTPLAMGGRTNLIKLHSVGEKA